MLSDNVAILDINSVHILGRKNGQRAHFHFSDNQAASNQGSDN